MAGGGAQVVPASGTFTPGVGRYAFGITSSSGAFVYAPTALYLAGAPDRPAQGPFRAILDPTSVPPRDRSRENAAPGGLRAVFEAEVPLPRPGVYDVLALTLAPGGGYRASRAAIAVARTSPVPDVGRRPPAIDTLTPASVDGDLTRLTTRQPPEHMNAVSFRRALGRRPIVLLFSTPALCVSRVCGPVTDILVALQREFGRRIVFIHQEVYRDNDPAKGFAPQMRAFHLRTEPWLFAINRRGVITARLEGTFGMQAARRALQTALS